MSVAWVGIDLGTTHTVVAWADSDNRAPRVFDIPQLVTAGESEALPLLASSLYAPLPGELPEASTGDPGWVVGAYARQRGQAVKGRLVASAKSWLSYAAVDRTAAILPWGAEASELGLRLSPVEASERVLAHVRRAWDHTFERPLRDQSIVLTVPASFDEVARELTVLAARQAGLNVRLLEEPQAAFYDFLERVGEEGLSRSLLEGRERATVLVCDVGGGTTDLAMIEVRRSASGRLELERVAVGRHLLLGGDNIDLALAYRCEAALVTPPERLDPSRFNQLVLACRGAKEALLSDDPPESVSINLASTGSALVGTTLTTRLTRAEVEAVVFDGFLPTVTGNAVPSRARAGLLAFGLPYEQDAAITRHIASFLARHSALPAPDALLLNGGLFRAGRAAKRLSDIIGSWSGKTMALLPQPHPELAVARGAVVYGRSLSEDGLRIGGGTPSGFYVAIEAGAERRALSVVPRGAREGDRHLTQIRGLVLRVGEPARFELFAVDNGEIHPPGTIVPLDDERFHALPPLTAVFDASDRADERELGVAIEGELSAVGTVDLACVELAPRKGAARRFRLAFDLRAPGGPRRSERPPSERGRSIAPSHSIAPPRSIAPVSEKLLAPAEAAILRSFGKGRGDVKPRETKDLVRELERLLGERRTWTLETNRALFDRIAPHHAARRRSEDHERVFWMLTGYCLRPGFGSPSDPRRIELIAPLLEAGIGFPQTRSWQQFFIALRRIAPGLGENVQVALRNAIDPWLAPEERKLKKSKQFRPLAPEEMLELASWLERVPTELRVELGRWLLERTWSNRDPRLWAAIGRIGSRVPTYASAHHVVPPSVAERWLDHLLRERWEEVPTATRAASLLARVTSDRARDIGDGVRAEVEKRLKAAAAPAEWIRAVREFVPLEESERADWFGDELPVGLRLRQSDDRD